MLKSFACGLYDLIFPRNCVLCKKSIQGLTVKAPLCPYCQSLIKANTPPFCMKCSRHLDSPQESTLCRQCNHLTQHFDNVWSVSLYNDVMRKLIHLFKYGNKTSLRLTFLDVIRSFLKNYEIDLSVFDAAIPIPLHPTRLRERGYNQAQVLAETIKQPLGLKVSYGNLLRIRHTTNQAKLKEKERWTNIKGAFKIRNPEEVSGQSVLIIDDLLSTGATISEVASCLKKAKAKRVSALTLAIAY